MHKVIEWHPGRDPFVSEWPDVEYDRVRRFLGNATLCTAFVIPFPDRYSTGVVAAGNNSPAIVGFVDDDGHAKGLRETTVRWWDGALLVGKMLICARMPGREGRLRGLDAEEIELFGKAWKVTVRQPTAEEEADELAAEVFERFRAARGEGLEDVLAAKVRDPGNVKRLIEWQCGAEGCKKWNVGTESECVVCGWPMEGQTVRISGLNKDELRYHLIGTLPGGADDGGDYVGELTTPEGQRAFRRWLTDGIPGIDPAVRAKFIDGGAR